MFCDIEGVVLYVTNLEPGRDFYSRILQLPVRSETQTRIAFHIPKTQLILELDANGAVPIAPVKTHQSPIQAITDRRSALALLVEDIDSAVFHLNRNGVQLLTPIEDRNGLWVCEIADPYGNSIAIAQLNEIRG